MIVLRERNKDFQVRSGSSVANLLSLAFILGDSTKGEATSRSGPRSLSVKPEKCAKEVESDNRKKKEWIQFPLSLLTWALGRYLLYVCILPVGIITLVSIGFARAG